MTPARARTRRRLAGAALSLAVHAAILLAFLGVTPRLVVLPHLGTPPEPAFQLELARPSPRASASSATVATRRDVSATAIPPRSLPHSSGRPAADVPLQAPSRPQGPPAIAAARRGLAATGTATPDGRWRVRGEGGDADAAARALVRGTIGCADAEWLHLTADERDHCNAEFVRGMRTLRPDAIPAAKRAYYDQVVAKIEEARGLSAVAPHPSRPSMLRSPSHGLDATIGAHCAFRFGPGAAHVNRDDPCRLHLPLSPLTAETHVPAPSSLADRAADALADAKLEAPAPDAPPRKDPGK